MAHTLQIVVPDVLKILPDYPNLAHAISKNHRISTVSSQSINASYKLEKQVPGANKTISNTEQRVFKHLFEQSTQINS